MFSTCPLKGSFRASFFIGLIFLIFSFQCFSKPRNEKVLAPHSIVKIKSLFDEHHIKKIADNHVWLSLIHSDGEKSYIDDEDFILSRKNFSPAKEMELTLVLLLSDDKAVCRFPARYLWLKDYFNLPDLDYSHCSDFFEYLQMAPAESLELVFASENISQPSSMMGHVLLKLVGTNKNGDNVSHAVSFYTDAGGINIPKLFWQSIVIGKKGYFSLTPYKEKIQRYLNVEGRNIWEYKIKADKKHRDLIHFHIYELKKTNLVYFFDDYNCATLVHYVLGILGAKSRNLFWVTPSDVVKEIHDSNLVETATLLPSNRWKIQMLSKTVETDIVSQTKKSVDTLDPNVIRKIENDKTRFIAYEMADSYARFSLRNGDFKNENENEKKVVRFLRQLKVDRSVDPEFNIDLSRYKLPTKTPQDSQLAIGLIDWYDQTTYLKLDLLPAAHTLSDDNRQYFADTELTLGDISIMVSPDQNTLKIHHLTLYGITSLMPKDRLTGGMSGRFQLGYKQMLHKNLTPHGYIFGLGALGQTIEFLDGVKYYGLMGGGVAASRFDAFGFVQPEFGLSIERIPALKTRLSLEYLFSDSALISDQKRYKFEQSYFFNQSWSVYAQLSKVKINERSQSQGSISLKHYF